MKKWLLLSLLPVIGAFAVEQGQAQLRLNGKTLTINGLKAAITHENGKIELYMGAADTSARTKVNIVLTLPADLSGKQSFSSLSNEMLFTLRSPQSTMMIMPAVQPVKTPLQVIETNPNDPEGFGAAMAARDTRPLYELNKEERNQRHNKLSRHREFKSRTFRVKQEDWAKMDLSTRIKTGQGIQKNPGQDDTAIFITVEPVVVNGTIVELKGTLSGFAPGKSSQKRWLLETSEFRAEYLQPQGGK